MMLRRLLSGGSQYVDPLFQSLPVSPTLAISMKQDELRRQGRVVHPCGFGQSPFPVPECVVHSLREHATARAYLPVQGLPELQDRVAGWFHRTGGVPHTWSAADVRVGPGSKELIFLVQMAFHGDILLPSPSWVSYLPQARMARKSVRLVDTSFETQWKVTPESLEKACSASTATRHLLILNYPNNPVGNTYHLHELEALVQVCRAHNITILGDEIYAGVQYSHEPHHSIGKLYPENSIISTGLSKWAGAGGWRLGVMGFSPELRPLADAVASLASETYSCVSAPIQWAALQAFEPDLLDHYLACERLVLRVVGSHVFERLQAAGLQLVAPEGGFYVFPDFSPFASALLEKKGVENSEQLCEVLLRESGVALLPGSAFLRPANELTTRLSYCVFDGKRALDVAAFMMSEDRGDEYLLEHLPEVDEALKALERWLGSL